MKKIALYFLGAAIICIAGCAMKTIEYPKEWSPLVKTTDKNCFHIAGMYKNLSHNHISGPTTTYDYATSVSQVLHGKGLGPSSIESIEIILHSDEYLEFLFFDKDGQTFRYKKKPYKVKYFCDNGKMTVEDDEYPLIFKHGYLGVATSRIDLHKNLNKDLVVHKQSNFVGLFFFIPMTLPNDAWFQCAAIEKKKD